MNKNRDSDLNTQDADSEFEAVVESDDADQLGIVLAYGGDGGGGIGGEQECW